jgi:hypothetical protein
MMTTLFDKAAFDEIISRIEKLSPQTQRLWGKMNVNQMLAHCSVGIQTATGEKFLRSSLFLRIIGSLFKSMTTNDKPFSHGSPTHQGFIIGNTDGFEKEKENLLNLLNKFHVGGESKCTDNPHAFFGRLAPRQWGSLMYKHIDHHLKQFNV